MCSQQLRRSLVGSRSESSLLTKRGTFLNEEMNDVREHCLKLKPRSERLSPNKFTSEMGSQVRAMASWYNESLGSLSASFSQKSTSRKTSVPISSALLTQGELEEYVKKSVETGEDVVSLVSLKSVHDDPAMRGYPLACCPIQLLRAFSLALCWSSRHHLFLFTTVSVSCIYVNAFHTFGLTCAAFSYTGHRYDAGVV